MERMRFPRLAYNFISALGAAMALVAGLFIVIMLVINFTMEQTPTYFGIFLYMVLPAFLILGLLLIPIGMFRQWRRVQRGEVLRAGKWPVVDLNDKRHRNATLVFGLGTIFFFAVSAVGGYEAFHYTESVEFCGEVCHTIMKPQYTAYQDSPHARVACVECHVGTGAGWYARSKLSGAYQVYAALADKYPQPIPTPIENLRPARETCEECHWPEKTYGISLRQFKHYMYDDENTPWNIEMEIITDTGEPVEGQRAGIHWHINPDIQIEYIARDEKRQDIPWVRVTDKHTGAVTVYENTDDPLDQEAIDTMEVRIMDCIDCHNRPSHHYHSPDFAMDRALQSGWVDTDIPEIKAVAVELMAEDYDTDSLAMEAIASGIKDEYTERGYLEMPGNEARIEQAIAGVQKAFSKNMFPHMEAYWYNYPNNVGHFTDIGCMRCHGGLHESKAGDVVTHDCNACHLIQSQGPDGAIVRDSTGAGLEFNHPEDIFGAWQEMGCYECHTGEQP